MLPSVVYSPAGAAGRRLLQFNNSLWCLQHVQVILCGDFNSGGIDWKTQDIHRNNPLLACDFPFLDFTDTYPTH